MLGASIPNTDEDFMSFKFNLPVYQLNGEWHPKPLPKKMLNAAKSDLVILKIFGNLLPLLFLCRPSGLMDRFYSLLFFLKKGLEGGCSIQYADMATFKPFDQPIYHCDMDFDPSRVMVLALIAIVTQLTTLLLVEYVAHRIESALSEFQKERIAYIDWFIVVLTAYIWAIAAINFFVLFTLKRIENLKTSALTVVKMVNAHF